MISKFHRWLLRKVFIYRIFIAILRKFSLPGFQGVRIYTVLSFFFREFRSKDITTRASAISFNFFLALFPATIFFFTLIAYVPITHFQDEIFKFIENITPKEAFEAIRHTLEDILKNRQGGLLSLGFVLAFYFSATGINSLIDAFNDYTHSVTARKALKQQLTAFWLTLYSTFLGIICVTLIIVGNVVLSFLNVKHVVGDSLEYYLILGSQWFLTILFIYCLISGLFYYGPSKKRKWPFFSAGSTLATILSLLSTLAFSFYVNNFDSYNRLYGSIGTLIVIMLLIYINSMALLVGFELNVSVDRALHHRVSAEKITPQNLENTFKNKRYE